MLRLAAIAAASVAAASAANTPYTLQMVDASAQGAVCLDGSNIGFYWAPGSGADVDKWILYQQGGGWCYDEYDCLGRSNTNLGSSKHWAPTTTTGGLMSNDCTTNPLFCNYNKVYMIYCDGHSFAGNADAPITVNGTQLYFRGARVLESLLAAAATGQMKPAPASPLSKASRIVFTGCSAGGLATYLNQWRAQAFAKAIAPQADFRSISISGFFMDYPSMGGPGVGAVYANQMKYSFAMQNVTADPACLATYSAEDAWKCGMAQYIYASPSITAPFFALNSVYDSWQTNCVLTPMPVISPTSEANGNCSAAPGWAACSKDPAQCSAAQLTAGYLPFGSAVVAAFQAAPKYRAPGSGGFLTSCHTHCEAQSDGAWDGFQINGTSIRQAVADWLALPPTAPPQWHVDCAYTATPGKPYCNSACGGT